MRKLIIFTFLLVCGLGYGQQKQYSTKKNLRKLKKELSKQKISDYFVVKRITFGDGIRLYDLNDPNSCKAKESYFTMYAFWEKENKTFVKKMDNCGGFNTIELTDSKSTQFYKLNIEKIKNDQVEIYKTRADSIANGKTYSFHSSQPHSPLRYFWFYQGSNKFENSFDTYNLMTVLNYKNINYETNNNLSIVKLNRLCDEILGELYEKKLFNRLK